MSAPSERPPHGLLALRRGHSPNCSSAGSVVGLALLTAALSAAVLNAWAWRFLQLPMGGAPPPPGDGGAVPDGPPVGGPPVGGPAPEVPQDDGGPRALRRESFGGVMAVPGALLYVDREATERALAAGVPEIGLDAPSEVPGALRAPTEVHLAVTERCPASCSGCYLGAGPDRQPPEPGLAALKADLAQLAALGVFEVAFGGGEALLREELLELAQTARELGMVPNLTTSGFGVTPQKARRMAALFGQVNVSLDGLGEDYVASRGWDGAALGLRAISTLREAGLRVGVNTALTRPLLTREGALEALGAEITAKGAAEWQWLRFKPAGRGTEAWARLSPSPIQLDALWSRALSLEASTGLTMRFDCALAPFLASAGLPPERLERMGVTGCPGGHSLWSRHADGRWAPCSFTEGDPGEGPLGARWSEDAELVSWRDRADAPPEPCASCEAQAVCRGGCRVVARALTGDPLAPDPQCPRVRAWAAS